MCSLPGFLPWGKHCRMCTRVCAHKPRASLPPAVLTLPLGFPRGRHLHAGHTQVRDVLPGSPLSRSSLTSSCSFFRDFLYLEHLKSHPRILLPPASGRQDLEGPMCAVTAPTEVSPPSGSPYLGQALVPSVGPRGFCLSDSGLCRHLLEAHRVEREPCLPNENKW